MNHYTNQVSPVGEDAVEPCHDGWEHCSRPVVSIFKGQDPTKVCDQVVLWNFLRVPINWVPAEHVQVEDTTNSGNCQAKNGGDCDGCNKYGLCDFTREDPSHDGVEYLTLEEALAKVDELIDGSVDIDLDQMEDISNEIDRHESDAAAWDLIKSHTSCAREHLSNARYEWDEARHTCPGRVFVDGAYECHKKDPRTACLFSYCPKAHESCDRD